ncbi:unnamed protein product [Withania somnifera]
MERENKACDVCKKDYRLIHRKGVLSFFKVMIDISFLQVMYFPPKFARSVPHLKDQETYLEDSSGRRWRVAVCNHNGSLSILQGWPKFSSDRGLNVGDFLVFHYVPSDQHFIVQIFGTSGCEKIEFCSDIGKGRKRSRTYPEAPILPERLLTANISSVKQKSKISAESGKQKGATAYPEAPIPDECLLTTDMYSVKKKSRISPESRNQKGATTYPEATTPAALLQTTDINSVKKKRKMSSESESVKVPYKPNTSTFATNVDAATVKAQSVHTAIDVDESFCMINRNAQYDHEDDRLCLHLSNFEMPASRPLAQGISIPLKGDNQDDNHVEANLRSQTEPHLNVEVNNLNSEAVLSKLGAGITSTDMVSGRAENIPLLGQKYTKSKGASQFAREATLVKKEFEEITSEAFSPATAKHISYSCLLEIDGRDFLELPESWLKHSLRRAKLGRMIIFLRGPDKRIWPTLYHNRSGFNVLTYGWKQVTTTYGLNPGDECLFQLVNQRGCLFDVRKI